jgi:hypothetical protein
MSKLFTKDPNETIDITIDWGNILDLEGSPDDFIDTSTWTLPSPTASPDTDDLTTSGPNIIGNKTTAFFASGVEGQTYRVKNVITTTVGATFERHIYIQVVQTEPGLFSSGMTVEDGTIVAGSNSYATREYISGYHAARDNSTWFDLIPQEMDAHAILATDFITQQYTARWKGLRINQTQPLDWPRAGVITEDFRDPDTAPSALIRDDLAFLFPEDEVPDEVRQAQAILALESISGGLNPAQSRGGAIKRMKAGSAEIEYFASADSASRTFPAVRELLVKYLEPKRQLLERG